MVVRGLDRTVHATLAGDGCDRGRWEKRAAAVCGQEPRLKTYFPGWTTGRQLDALFDASDLLVVPSVWPEPFGLIGLQAAEHGLPSVGFAVGGIPDWLRPGVNGQLADANPPTAETLARAVIECLKDPSAYARLREGAGRLSSESTYKHHIRDLLRIFEQVLEPGMKEPARATGTRGH
jgi:glycosyltransferase involved in cell wall biosynthesis